MGDPRETFGRALAYVAPFAEVREVSRLYRSKPYGFADQPDFLNAVAKISTDLAPLPLLRKLRRVESTLGKKVDRENGPRVIDLDLLFYGDKVMESEELTLPHPGIPDRDFVLLPLEELTPELIHPLSGRMISELARDSKISFVTGNPEKWNHETFQKKIPQLNQNLLRANNV